MTKKDYKVIAGVIMRRGGKEMNEELLSHPYIIVSKETYKRIMEVEGTEEGVYAVADSMRRRLEADKCVKETK